MNAIEIKDLTKYYGSHLGAKDINLAVKKGSIHGFIGPNGAGKSTTLKMLLNVIFPTKGQAKILGLDIINDAKEIKLLTGYLPSEINLYEKEKVSNILEQTLNYYLNISTENYPKLKGLNTIFDLNKTERANIMTENLARINNLLGVALDKKFGELSFGNKKKVGLAISMIHSPKILILDEPTGGLDPLMQDEYFKLLHNENHKGVTIFFSSHILSEVERICEKVTIIKNGSIVDTTDINNFKGRSIKNIRIITDEAGVKNLKDLMSKNKDFSNITKTESELGLLLTFTYTKEVNYLLNELLNIKIVDLSIVDPTLEETFRHYYEGSK